MYFYSDKQISLFDFGEISGIELNPDNRWIKISQLIDWDTLEAKYSKVYCDDNGRPGTSVRLALAAMLIKQIEGLTDEEIVLHISENPYMQYLCGFNQFKIDPPFVSSMMVEFRRRFGEEIIREINESMFKNDKAEPESAPENHGTIILDATCTPADIAFPQDIKLCNDAREKTEEIIEILHKPLRGKKQKPRLDKKKAKKEFKKIAKMKKRKSKEMRCAIRNQLSYIRRNLGYIDEYSDNIELLSKKQKEELETIRKVYEQQKYMIDNDTHSVENRIVSISQSYIRPIVRGKINANVEFGAKVAISVINKFAFVDKISWDAYNESSDLIPVIEDYKNHYGFYPEAVMVDKIYRTRANVEFCKLYGIRISGDKLGRPKKENDADKKQAYQDSCVRNAVEGKFGIVKVKYGLSRVMARTKDTSETVINLAFGAMNLWIAFCRFLLNWLGILKRRVYE
jgi:hypothetical protein